VNQRSIPLAAEPSRRWTAFAPSASSRAAASSMRRSVAWALPE